MKFFKRKRNVENKEEQEVRNRMGEYKKTAWKIFPGCFIRYKQNQACFCFSL